MSSMTKSLSLVGRNIPNGIVLPYAGATAPTDWLLCDGAEYSQATYAALFAILSTTYDTQYNPVTGSNWAAPSGGNFRVPDYRGLFLRGTGTPNGLDTVTLGSFQDQKTAKNGLSLTDPGHKHNMTTYLDTGGFGEIFPIGGGSGSARAGSANGMGSATTGISMGNGDNETRAINKGVNYIIKI